jgi:hypothetical protein
MDGYIVYRIAKGQIKKKKEGMNGLTGFVWENSRTDGTRPHA